MATVIGTEAYKLVADTRGFIKGVGDAQKSIGGFSSSLKSFVVGAGAIGTVTGTVGAAFALMDARAARASASMAALADATQILGDSSPAFVKFVKIAEQFNVSADATTAVALKMSRTLAEGKGRDAVEKLGLDFERLRSVGAGEMLAEVVTALRDIADVGERTSILTALGGKGAASLQEMLTGSASEWEMAAKAAGEYAEHVKAADIALADYVGTLRKANEARLSGTGAGGANTALLAEEMLQELSAGRGGLSRELLNTSAARFFARRVMDTGIGRFLDPQLFFATQRREQEVRAAATLEAAQARFDARQAAGRNMMAGLTSLPGALNPREALSRFMSNAGGVASGAIASVLRFVAGDVKTIMKDIANRRGDFAIGSGLAPGATGADAVLLGQQLSDRRRQEQEAARKQQKLIELNQKQADSMVHANKWLESIATRIENLGPLGVMR